MNSVDNTPRMIKCKVWMPHFKTSSHRFSREFDFLMGCFLA